MTAAGSMPWRAPARPVRLLLHRRGNILTHDQQRAKLDLIVQVAHDVWG
jgi:hypothetical protein